MGALVSAKKKSAKCPAGEIELWKKMYGGEYIMNQGDADTLFGPFCTWLERDDRYGRTSGLKMASEPDSSPDSKHLPIQASKLPSLQRLVNSYCP
jgi:hypothetical protein